MFAIQADEKNNKKPPRLYLEVTLWLVCNRNSVEKRASINHDSTSLSYFLILPYEAENGKNVPFF